ncbi:unnamed protein product, partial [Discosporangium mesarthrocarpum]
KPLDIFSAREKPSQVSMDDLFDDDDNYIPRNIWINTKSGAVHLIMPANTLSAEVELAVGAMMVRVTYNRTLTDSQGLIYCSAYSNTTRNSDPLVVNTVNSLARQGYNVCLIDPVATPQGWETPYGTDPLEFWGIEHGTGNMALHCMFEVPETNGYVVEDVMFRPGSPIEFGSQIADFVRVKLTAMA